MNSEAATARKPTRTRHNNSIHIEASQRAGQYKDIIEFANSMRKKYGSAVNAIAQNVRCSEEFQRWKNGGQIKPAAATSSSDRDPRMQFVMANATIDMDQLFAGRRQDRFIIHGKHEPTAARCIDLRHIEFDLDAQCPKWTALLKKACQDDEDRIAIIQEAFGYCLWDSTELERFFILVGSGQNARAAIIRMLEELIGWHNRSEVSPDELQRAYERGEMHRNLANVATTLACGALRRSAMLRTIEAGIQSICRDEQRKARTKLLFNVAELPKIIDARKGIWQRAIITRIDGEIDEREFGIDELLKELPGIFFFAVHGWIRLLKNRRFTEDVDSKELRAKQDRNAQQVKAFLDEETELDDESATAMADIYAAYGSWCKDHGLTKPKPLHMFARDVYEFRPNIRRERRRDDDGERKVQLAGIRLKRPEGI